MITDDEKASSVLSKFGLSLAHIPLSLEGRVLCAETIFLGKSKFSTNRRCDWFRNLVDDILVAVAIETWILVYEEKTVVNAQKFSKTLMEVGSNMGIRINPPKLVALPNDRTETYIIRIKEEIHAAVIWH